MSTKRYDELSVSERILLLQDLWDQLALAPEQVELTEAQRRELERRVALLEAHPERTLSWDEVRAALRARTRDG